MAVTASAGGSSIPVEAGSGLTPVASGSFVFLPVSLFMGIPAKACEVSCPFAVETFFAVCWAVSSWVSITTSGAFDVDPYSILMEVEFDAVAAVSLSLA